MGRGDVRGEARALVEPVGLAELADDAPVRGEVAEDAFAHVADGVGEGGPGLPIALKHRGVVEGERLPAREAGEVEFRGREHAGLDRALVGAELGLGELGEEAGPFLGRELADVADDRGGAMQAGGEARRVVGLRAEELGVMDLELADFVGVGRGDAPAGGAAGLVAEDVDAVGFPGEVEDAVRDVADHAAFVDQQAGQDGDADLLERQGLPEGLARVGHDAGAERQAGHVMFGHAAGKEVELQSGDRVAGVRATVDLEDRADDIPSSREVLEFADDFGDEAAFAFVAHADADVGDEVALKVRECHGQERGGGR